MLKSTAIFTVLLAVAWPSCNGQYQPNWNSLDSRPLPSWYDEGKVGIFIHWGVFSVPGLVSEWFWNYWEKGNPTIVNFMKANYRPDWTYADFAKEFTVQEGIFDPAHWADIFNASGARYVVQVTKHHEGFTSWPSNHSFNWNAMDVGPKRDLVGELAQAVRKYPNLKYGVYHSLFEWFNPMFLKDQQDHFTTQNFVRDKTMPELYELVNTYKPELIWSDGTGGANSTYWNSTYFLAWLYNDSPVKDTIIVNDRWGSDCGCKHGGYYTCSDRFNPGVLQKHKFENAMTLDKHSWGVRRNAVLSDILTMEELITLLARTVSCNGNLLINVGPTKDGVINLVFEERLRQFGSWMAINGEGIYKTRPWTYQNDTTNGDVWYTTKTEGSDKYVYAIALKWPEDTLVLGAPNATSSTVVTLLGYQGTFDFDHTSGKQGMTVHIPTISINKIPCQWGWVFKLTNISN